MNLIAPAHQVIADMKAIFQSKGNHHNFRKEELLSAELYSSEQMKRFGKALAKTHKLSAKPAQDHLLKRLADNETLLHEVRKLLN